MLHTTNPIIKHKAGLLNLAEELGNVSKACKIMGVSRDTFYRYQELAEEGGIDALVNQNRRVPNLKNRADEATERAVVEYAVEFPAHGQHRTSNELRKKGVFISGSGVRSIWQRHDLENFRKRLKALEEKVAREGIVLTDAQIAALEKKAHDDEASGEIETAHPGYLGSQDTFYVGNLKGVGRIYQQTFVDTYSKVAQCKLYTSKTPITAADLLNDRVLPFYEAQGLPMLRILTDRGLSTAVKWSSMITSCIWPSTISTIRKRRQCHRRRTASVSASIKPFCRNFIRLRSARSYMQTWKVCKWIWTTGCGITIMNELIRGKCAAGVRQWPLYLMENGSGQKKI